MGKTLELPAHGVRYVDEIRRPWSPEKDDCRPAFHAKVGRLLERFSFSRALSPRAGTMCGNSTASIPRTCTSFRETSAFDSYVELQLPFQVLYQSFVSRSFAVDAEGFPSDRLPARFRICSPLLYYMCAMGNDTLAREMLSEWAEKAL